MSWRKHKVPHKRQSMPKHTQNLDLNNLVSSKCSYVIGVDEVGWGSIAGPLVVVAAVVPWDFVNPGIKDSKRYTTHNSRAKGATLAEKAVSRNLVYEVSPNELAKYGPGSALAYAQREVVQNLLMDYPDALVVLDGNKPLKGLESVQQLSVPAADARVPVVSAASIIAKHYRDSDMMGDEYPPEWCFHKNKGYATPEHIENLQRWGPIKGVHRMNVTLVKNAYEKRGWYNGPQGSQ